MKKKAANRRPSQRLDERDLDYDDDEAADKNVPDHVKDNDDYGDGDAKDLFYESDEDLLSKKEKRKREDMDAQLELDANAKRETAEEKRRRLARLYLDKLRREAALEGDDDTDLDENDDVDPSVRKRQRDLDSHDRLANKLANEAAEAAGRHFREIADDVKPTKSPVLGTYFSRKAHKQSVTGVCLSSDDRTAFSVSKDGAIVEWDVETGKRTKYPRCPVITEEEMRTKGGGGPMAPPRSGAGILLAVACASEKNVVAVAGNDKRIHVFDMRTKKFVTTFAGHRGAVTGLTFRHGTGQLFSCSEDRTVKIWSVDDMAYVDTLFGHQSELNGIDAHKRERCATVSSDRTLRAWKVAEDSQLVFRPAMNDDKRKDYAMECVASVSHDHWITGARDGAVSLWSASKKKPLSTFSNMHGYDEPIGLPKNWEEEDGEIVVNLHPRMRGVVAIIRGRNFMRLGDVRVEQPVKDSPLVLKGDVLGPSPSPGPGKELVELGTGGRLGGLKDDEGEHDEAGHVEDHGRRRPVRRTRHAAAAAGQRDGSGPTRFRRRVRKGSVVGPGQLGWRVAAAAIGPISVGLLARCGERGGPPAVRIGDLHRHAGRRLAQLARVRARVRVRVRVRGRVRVRLRLRVRVRVRV